MGRLCQTDGLTDDQTEILKAVRSFVEREILPVEGDRDAFDAHENIRLDRLEALRGKARAEGLWCLQLKPETGGQLVYPPNGGTRVR